MEDMGLRQFTFSYRDGYGKRAIYAPQEVPLGCKALWFFRIETIQVVC